MIGPLKTSGRAYSCLSQRGSPFPTLALLSVNSLLKNNVNGELEIGAEMGTPPPEKYPHSIPIKLFLKQKHL